MWTACRWRADDVRTTREWDFWWDFIGVWHICNPHVIHMSSAHRADDKRQQLCIKPTGFLVITIVTEKGRSLEHAVIFLRNGIPENFNDVQKTMIFIYMMLIWKNFGRILPSLVLNVLTLYFFCTDNATQASRIPLKFTDLIRYFKRDLSSCSAL